MEEKAKNNSASASGMGADTQSDAASATTSSNSRAIAQNNENQYAPGGGLASLDGTGAIGGQTVNSGGNPGSQVLFGTQSQDAEARMGEDPEDYFTRINLEESLFKKITQDIRTSR